MDAQSAPRRQLGGLRAQLEGPRAFRRLSNGFPRAFQDTPDPRKPCARAGGKSIVIFFAVLAFNRALWLNLECPGDLLGASWAQPGRSWGQLEALLRPPWVHEASLELLLEALGRIWEAPRICLGGPERSRELCLEAQSDPRRKLGDPKHSEKPILEASSSLRYQFGDPLPSEELNLEEQST